jgi:hypothetical protein
MKRALQRLECDRTRLAHTRNQLPFNPLSSSASSTNTNSGMAASSSNIKRIKPSPSSHNSHATNLSNVPRAVLLECIMTLIDAQTLTLTCQRVCRQWYQLVNQSTLRMERYWKNEYKQSRRIFATPIPELYFDDIDNEDHSLVHEVPNAIHDIDAMRAPLVRQSSQHDAIICEFMAHALPSPSSTHAIDSSYSSSPLTSIITPVLISDGANVTDLPLSSEAPEASPTHQQVSPLAVTKLPIVPRNHHTDTHNKNDDKSTAIKSTCLISWRQRVVAQRMVDNRWRNGQCHITHRRHGVPECWWCLSNNESYLSTVDNTTGDVLVYDVSTSQSASQSMPRRYACGNPANHMSFLANCSPSSEWVLVVANRISFLNLHDGEIRRRYQSPGVTAYRGSCVADGSTSQPIAYLCGDTIDEMDLETCTITRTALPSWKQHQLGGTDMAVHPGSQSMIAVARSLVAPPMIVDRRSLQMIDEATTARSPMLVQWYGDYLIAQHTGQFLLYDIRKGLHHELVAKAGFAPSIHSGLGALLTAWPGDAQIELYDLVSFNDHSSPSSTLPIGNGWPLISSKLTDSRAYLLGHTGFVMLDFAARRHYGASLSFVTNHHHRNIIRGTAGRTNHGGVNGTRSIW